MGATRRVTVQDGEVDVPASNGADPQLLADSSETRSEFLPHLQLFWANRHVLLRAGVWALLVSTLVAFLIPPRYRSVTRLMPPDQSSSGLGLLTAMAGSVMGNNASSLGTLASDVLGLKTSGALFVGILNSDTAKDALIEKFQLKKVYHDRKIEDARDDLANHTDITEERKSGIITLAVTDHDPKRAAAIAQEYVEQLNRLVALLSTSAARRERIFLEGRLEEVRHALESAERNFSDFASRNTAVDIPAQARAMVQAAAALQGELIAAQAELSGLQQIYTENNSRVRAAEARVKELQNRLAEMGGAGTQDQLKRDTSLYPSIRKLPLLGVTYADLFRQSKIQETVYGLLTQQYELARVQEAKEIPTVRVLDVANVPTKRAFPPRLAVVILGTMLGVAGTMMWIHGKTRWDSVDESDPRKALAKEVLSTAQARLPRFSRNGVRAEASEAALDSPRESAGFGNGRRPIEEREKK